MCKWCIAGLAVALIASGCSSTESAGDSSEVDSSGPSSPAVTTGGYDYAEGWCQELDLARFADVIPGFDPERAKALGQYTSADSSYADSYSEYQDASDCVLESTDDALTLRVGFLTRIYPSPEAAAEAFTTRDRWPQTDHVPTDVEAATVDGWEQSDLYAYKDENDINEYQTQGALLAQDSNLILGVRTASCEYEVDDPNASCPPDDLAAFITALAGQVQESLAE